MVAVMFQETGAFMGMIIYAQGLKKRFLWEKRRLNYVLKAVKGWMMGYPVYRPA